MAISGNSWKVTQFFCWVLCFHIFWSYFCKRFLQNRFFCNEMWNSSKREVSISLDTTIFMDFQQNPAFHFNQSTRFALFCLSKWGSFSHISLSVWLEFEFRLILYVMAKTCGMLWYLHSLVLLMPIGWRFLAWNKKSPESQIPQWTMFKTYVFFCLPLFTLRKYETKQTVHSTCCLLHIFAHWNDSDSIWIIKWERMTQISCLIIQMRICYWVFWHFKHVKYFAMLMNMIAFFGITNWYRCSEFFYWP